MKTTILTILAIFAFTLGVSAQIFFYECSSYTRKQMGTDLVLQDQEIKIPIIWDAGNHVIRIGKNNDANQVIIKYHDYFEPTVYKKIMGVLVCDIYKFVGYDNDGDEVIFEIQDCSYPGTEYEGINIMIFYSFLDFYSQFTAIRIK